MMPRKIVRHLSVGLLVAALVAPGAIANERFPGNNNRIQNVIVMVPDGCSLSVLTLSRWIKGGSLALDDMTSGSVKTFMADSIITDSASAATAFASGHKTSDKFLGVGPDAGTLLTGFKATAGPYVPVASVLEGAKLKGMATGLVATSAVTHATPASFAVHLHSRSLDNDIMEQIVYQDIDVVFGGGKNFLLPTVRPDGEDLKQVLLDRGYQFVETADDMTHVKGGKVWGLFAAGHMDPDMDRDDLNPTQPSIAQMTEKAIDLLSRNRNGFFLLVEGSQVDWAGHANDAAYMAGDFMAFDEAVKVAVSFARKDRHTLVLAFPDHNTGALSLGHQQSGFPPSYTKTRIEDLIAPIKDATMTIQALLYQVPSPATAGNVRDTFVTYHGGYWEKMTREQAGYIAGVLNEKGPKEGYYEIAQYVSRELTVFGWTTHGHAGEDVPLWTFGPQRPVGTYDNTELARMVADALGFDLAQVSGRQFVDVADVFPGYEVDASDPDNLVLKIKGYELPVNKDLLIKGHKAKQLDGIVVYAPKIDKWFIPMDAVRMIR